ncbi:uncharacterized protein OCT59_007294 [Rhizophagus irregularis]|uniref:uncharacterized protein n=1 Tax=Rhizophagus irregularis TaxID=588596 RepID=UPI00332A49FE|nr:hypothetical protein OCT59_007294 [Rhizophagus irregularis]
MDANISGIRFWYGYRYSRNSVPVWKSISAWIPIFQVFFGFLLNKRFPDLCGLDFYWVSKDGGKNGDE